MHVETAAIHRCKLPLEHSYQLSSTLGELTHGHPVVLELRTESGAVGVGETNPSVPFMEDSPATVVNQLQANLPMILDGVDATNLHAVHRRMDATLGETNRLARAAVDVACHDLLGKRLDTPVHAILGGTLRDELPILKPLGNEPPTNNARTAAAEVAAGFESFMVKTGYYPIDEDIERLEAIRERVGDDIGLVIDANQGWDASTAIEFARQVDDRGFDVAFIEQPVPASDVNGLKRVRDGSPIPVSADESLFSMANAMRLLEANAVDVFSIKIAKHGGIYPARRIMEFAAAHDVPCFMNSMIEAGISQAASLQLGTTMRNVLDGGHAYMSPLRLDSTLTEYEDRFTDGGTVRVRGEPGLGVSLDERAKRYIDETVEVTIA